MSDFEMLSIKFQEEGLKEIQVFVGMTHSFKDGCLSIDLYRNMSAGNISCLYLIYKEALTFSFNNRIVFIGVPPRQREELYRDLLKMIFKIETRKIIVTMHTKYMNPYSGEAVTSGSEQYILDKEHLHIYESLVDETRYYKPIDHSDGDTESTFVTIADIVQQDIPTPGDKSKIRAIAAMEYLKDVRNYFYTSKEGVIQPHNFLVFPKVFHDPSDGKVMIGSHIHHMDNVHDGAPLWNVTFKTKDGLREHSMVFIDPYNALDIVLKSKDVILRFRDASLYGADFNLADFDIEYYAA